MMGNSFDPYSGLLKGAWLTGPSEPDRTKLDPHTIFYDCIDNVPVKNPTEP